MARCATSTTSEHDTSPSGRRTILVVDDEPDNRELLRAWLTPGFRVLLAEGGAQALELLGGSESVDLVLLDVMMPQLDGYMTCRAVKASHDEGYLPVILLTALDDQDSRNQGLQAGADEFLSKPVDRRELLLRVQGLLKVRAQEARIRAQVHELTRLQGLKDDLVSLIVHDMRNPLNGVFGYLELLQWDLRERIPEADELRRHVEAALNAVSHLNRLLEEVLEVKRLEEAEVPLKVAPCALSEVLHDAASTLAGAAQQRGQRIETLLESDLEATCDAGLLRRAVENLLANAIKVSEPGSAVVLSAKDDAQGLTVEVSDRGPGVSQSSKYRVFQRFTAGGPASGFGLGLYLVQLVATAHGGTTEVRDREGGGAVFSLSLPHPVGG